MKTNCVKNKFSVKFLALACLLAFGCQANAPHNEAMLYKLISEFLDKNCHKSFEQFVCEMQQLIGGNPHYSAFSNELNKMKKDKNHTKVALMLVKHKGIMPESIKNLITAKPNKELMEIVKRRVHHS